MVEDSGIDTSDKTTNNSAITISNLTENNSWPFKIGDTADWTDGGTANAIDENSNIQTSAQSQDNGTYQDFADYLIEGYWIDNNKLSRRDYRINTAGTITYYINDYSDYYKSKVLLALKFWSDATGLQFVEEPTYHNADLRFSDRASDFAILYPNVGRYINYCEINIESFPLVIMKCVEIFRI